MRAKVGVVIGTPLQFPRLRQKPLSPGIVTITRQSAYGFLITFSDGTYARYVVEELLELRPHRDMLDEL